jgi:L-malate glycosyltransferase
MNILHLALTSKWGGGANQIQNLTNEFASLDDCKQHLLTVKNGEVHKKISTNNIQLHVSPMAFNVDPRAIIKILAICKKEKIDLIHLHGPTAITIAIITQNIKKLPPLIFSKKTCFPIRKRRATLYKYNHPNIQKILCVSNKTKKISAQSILDHSKLVTIYNGTALKDKSDKTPYLLREKLSLDPETFIIGTIANHINAKDLDTWIEVIKEVVRRKSRSNFHFVQIGSFSDSTYLLKRKIKNYGLDKHVSFLGFVPHASNFIPQFDISLMTSKSEGIPQFIYESFYHKVPVVSTNVGGIPEIIEDGKNGMLSNPFEARSLADKLIALSSDKALREKFTELSYQKLVENFTTRKMAEQTLAEYKKVLYGKNGSGN